MGHITVSIILVNYNTRQMTLECIESVVSKVQSCSYEIILVDNASTDGSREFFENYPGIIYIYNKENLGFGKANNVGIEKSKGDYIFLLNTDTILRNDALKYFVEYEEQNEKNKVLGSWLLDINGNLNHSYGRFPTIKTELSSAFKVYLDRIPFIKKQNMLWKEILDGTEKEVDYITGADLFIPKKIIDRVGKFDENFFMYYEETDLERRLAQMGIKRILIPGPQIIHMEQGSQLSVNKKKNMKKLLLSTKSMLIYTKKYYTRVQYYCFKLLYFILRLPAMWFNEYSNEEKKEYFKLFFK